MDEIDEFIEETLTEDLEEEIPTGEESDPQSSSKFRAQVAKLTVAAKVSDAEYEQVIQEEVQRLSTELDVPQAVRSVANQLAGGSWTRHR